MSVHDRVIYKPLSQSIKHMEDEESLIDCQFDESFRSQSLFSSTLRTYCNLRLFRVVLYSVALLLLIIFVAQISSIETSFKSATHQDTPDNHTHKSPDPTDIPIVLNQAHLFQNYLSSVSREQQFSDDFHANGRDSAHSSSIWWTLNLRDKYVIVTNYIRAIKSFDYNASVTLTTQATTEFMHHTLELCKRWDGPISVAVFSPGKDLLVSTTLIKFMRQCLPDPLSACIRDKVTWHFVYDRLQGPLLSNISYPSSNLDSENYPLFVEQDQCPKFAGPDPADSIKQFENEMRKIRTKPSFPYPINVLRNTARLAANTKYVLASDIELYPSIHMAPSFINLIKNHDFEKEYDNIDRLIFTLPIFEVKSTVTAPKTKAELVKLFIRGDAVFFHKYVCDVCQYFPFREEWLLTDKHGHENYRSDGHESVIFYVTQRDRRYLSWEPIFIGTNDDPLYDDRLTWNGRRDKMSQMYEMCLLDYKLLILGDVFLVHSPGIKRISQQVNNEMYKFIQKNNAIYDETISKLKKQYHNSSNIDKC